MKNDKDCMTCIHRDICTVRGGPKYEFMCKNYNFSRSDKSKGCDRCLNKPDCWRGIDLMLFDCKYWQQRAAALGCEYVRACALELLEAMKEFEVDSGFSRKIAESAFVLLYGKLKRKEENDK